VIHELLRHELTNIEEARTRTCHMHILTVQGRFDEMLMNGVEALKSVGIAFEREPSKLQIAGLLLRTWRATRGVTPQKILSQPFNQDDRMRYASELLFLMTSAGFNFSIDLLSYMVLMRTMLVLEHGHSDVSIDTYALFGLVLNGMRMPVRAAKYAQMSIDLIPMSTDPGAIQRAHAIPATNVLIWTRPVAECIEHMERGAEVAIRAGKQHGTLWTLGVQAEQRLFAGHPLASVAAFIGDAAQSLHRVYQRNSGLPWTARYFEAAVQKVIHAFAPSLPHVHDYDELIADEEHLKDHIRSAKDATAMCSWLAADLQIAALLWNTDTALDVYEAFVPYKHGLSGQTLDIDREFYGGLAHAQRLVSSSPPHERRHLKGLQHAISAFTRWAKNNPSVFAHRLLFLQGAQHLALERIDEAVQSFAACIAHARAESDLRMEALALEWSSYAVDRSALRDAAAHYRRQAVSAWNAWGATVLAERLDTSRERAGGGPKDRSTVTSTIAADTLGLSQESIDIETVLKASSTIAGTIVFDELVHDMMRIVLENAGADRAVLVLDEDGTFAVVAETTMDGTVIEAEREPVSTSHLLCRPLLLQGLRIGATIVVDDAMMESDLVSDDYILSTQPRSVMVLPITHQAKTIGALYLENGNTTHVFTPERSRVLQLLSSQIAVSIENARLYGRQEQLVHSFARFVPVEFLESLGKKSILDVEVGDAVRRSTSILFADIRGFTTLSEQMDADRTFDFLNAYLERVVPIITRHNGFVDKYIGDAVMALFPYSGSDAIIAAVEIQRAVDDLNRMAHTQGWPSFQVGIGLHTGEVMLGTLGSDQRMDTTVIGDAVNVASRLESLTKVRGLRIVASEDLCTAAGEIRGVTYRKIGIEEIRGRRDPVTVFEVVS
jgi:class 3 adenylate cyclase